MATRQLPILPEAPNYHVCFFGVPQIYQENWLSISTAPTPSRGLTHSWCRLKNPRGAQGYGLQHYQGRRAHGAGQGSRGHPRNDAALRPVGVQRPLRRTTSADSAEAGERGPARDYSHDAGRDDNGHLADFLGHAGVCRVCPGVAPANAAFSVHFLAESALQLVDYLVVE